MPAGPILLDSLSGWPSHVLSGENVDFGHSAESGERDLRLGRDIFVWDALLCSGNRSVCVHVRCISVFTKCHLEKCFPM